MCSPDYLKVKKSSPAVTVASKKIQEQKEIQDLWRNT